MCALSNATLQHGHLLSLPRVMQCHVMQSQHATLSHLSRTGAHTMFLQIGHSRREVSTCAVITLSGVIPRFAFSVMLSMMAPSGRPRHFLSLFKSSLLQITDTLHPLSLCGSQVNAGTDGCICVSCS